MEKEKTMKQKIIIQTKTSWHRFRPLMTIGLVILAALAVAGLPVGQTNAHVAQLNGEKTAGHLGKPKSSSKSQTVAGYWKLDSLVIESDMLYSIVESITLDISENGKISGNGGCHNFAGRYSFKQPSKRFRKPRKIKFSEITLDDDESVSTKAKCRAASDTEKAFIKSLNSAASVVFEKENLVIQSKPTFVKTSNGRIVIQNTMTFVREKTEVLCDFRETEIPCWWGEPEKNDEFYALEVSKEESDRVLDYLFGKDRDQDLQVSTKFSGSFTKPNVKETLYSVRGCKKGEGGMEIAKCPDDSEPNAGWIAIHDGKKMTHKIDILLGYVIPFVTDVNSDGRYEILSLSETSAMGVTTMGAELGQISGSEYQTVFPAGEDNFFGSAEREDRCLFLATVVSYVPDRKFPAFTEEYFRRKGCKSSTWKRITRKKFNKYLDQKR
jgi:heat shock protein HslJ